MADNLCGPSNGAKNLVNYANQDRSLQQTRIAGGNQAGPSVAFRNPSTTANGANQAFHNFQQGAPVNPTYSPAPGIVPVALAHPAAGNGPLHRRAGRAMGGPPLGFQAFQTSDRIVSSGSMNQGLGPAHQNGEWINQFNNMHLENGHPTANPSARVAPIMPGQMHNPHHHIGHHMGMGMVMGNNMMHLENGHAAARINAIVPGQMHNPNLHHMGMGMGMANTMMHLEGGQIHNTNHDMGTGIVMGDNNLSASVLVRAFAPPQVENVANAAAQPQVENVANAVAQPQAGHVKKAISQHLVGSVDAAFDAAFAEHDAALAEHDAALAAASGQNVNVDAFNAAFGEYDDADFSAELAALADQQARDREFVEAQDRWMAEHGPRMSDEDREMEELAFELEQQRARGDPAVMPTQGEAAEAAKKRRQDEELAQAADSILSAVADETSEKFKNSNFFELMRRISRREVVVEDDHLVDTATGETVVTKGPPLDDEEGGAGTA